VFMTCIRTKSYTLVRVEGTQGVPGGIL
jgi:hypothetical protein